MSKRDKARRSETYSQCVSLAPPRAPLKLSLLHSIVFHMLLSLCGATATELTELSVCLSFGA